MDINANGVPDECEDSLQIPGDCHADGVVDMQDAICILGTLYLEKPSRFPCGDGKSRDAANIKLLDAQADGRLDISDAIWILYALLDRDTLRNGLGAFGPCQIIAGCPMHPRCP